MELRRHNRESVVSPVGRAARRVFAARSESFPRVFASRCDQRALGSNRVAAGPVVFQQTLRRKVAPGLPSAARPYHVQNALRHFVSTC